MSEPTKPAPPIRRRGGRALLAISLLLNLLLLVVIGAYAVRKGGVRYVKAEIGLGKHEVKLEPFQVADAAAFRRYPNGPSDIYFVGDSLTAMAPLAEVFSPIKNRGIGGDTTAGLLTRLDEVTKGHPRQVFLMIGTNDIAKELPIAEIVDNYRTILRRIRAESPTTKIVVEAVLPVSQPVLQSPVDRNIAIRKLNAELARLAGSDGDQFIDFTERFTDPQGNLKAELTKDGIHLNMDGRLMLCEALRPYVAVQTPATQP